MQNPINFSGDWGSFLRRVPIFSELEEEPLKKVAVNLQSLALEKGAILYKEGDSGDALYIILSGRVRVLSRSEDGKEKVLNYLGRGDTFGETALLTGAPRSVTIVADSNTQLYVLYKKDFESFLKSNPTSAYYLSRLVSQRLLAASHPRYRSAIEQKILGFFCDLPREEHILFSINLAIDVTEQTRRKVLLLEFSPYAQSLVQSIGLEFSTPSPSQLTSEKLQDPQFLEPFIQVHPSGLEILVLSPELLTDSLFPAIPILLESLRQMYDFVLLNFSGWRYFNEVIPLRTEEFARSFLNECDTVYYVTHGAPSNYKFVYSLLEKQQTIVKNIILGEKAPSSVSPIDFMVPWSDSAVRPFKRGDHPYLNQPENEWTQTVLNRIARSIGKLQIGIAMGSGAAYGYTLVGILKVFEREKIPIDFITGTSMGALIASFHAAGKSAGEIEQIALSITKPWLRSNFLSDLNLPWPHGGILLGHTISRFLRSVLGQIEFKDLKTPFACVATDIMTGEGVVLREGPVWEAVRASLSLPLIFCPYRWKDHFLVDGGLVNPVPTSVLASLGADTLISVNLTSNAAEKKISLRRLGMFPAKSPSMFNIFFKMIYTMEYQVALSKVDLAQISLRPQMKNISWVDFHKAKQIIPLGEQVAEEALPKIKSHLPFFSDYCQVSLRFPK